MATNDKDAAKCDLIADVIRNFGGARLKVTGTSMLPSVWPGDVIAVLRRNAGELLVGQIVLCYRNHSLVAHRLIGKRYDGLITRGDSLSYDDPPVREVDVLGEVVSIVRDGRTVALSSVWWHYAACWIVQRSEVCTRIMLRLRRSSRLRWVE